MFAKIILEKQGEATIYAVYVHFRRVASFEFMTLAQMWCRRMGLEVVE